MKIRKEIQAIYLKKIGIDWEGREPCGKDHCDGSCIGFKFTAMDRFYAERFERKYGKINGKER